MGKIGFFALFLSSCAFASTCAADPHEVQFDKDGTAYIGCACVVATSACVSALGDATAGSQRNTWMLTGSAKAGVKVDLSEYCWRRRDVEGGGLCCSLNNDKRDVRFFWGELDEIK